MTIAADSKRAAPAGQSKTRLLYIDNLRILLTILVIMHHFAIGYGGPGGFYYEEVGPMSEVSEILMTLLLAINQAFFMGFFFMISSYFSPGSVDRKGARTYLSDRFRRLGIPLIFYMFIVDPVLGYLGWLSRGNSGPVGPLVRERFSSITYLSAAQLWFVAALLFFSMLYVVWRRFAGPMSNDRTAAPTNREIALFALALGAVTFVVRIWISVGEVVPIASWQLAHFPQYIALYALGIAAYRRGWLQRVTEQQGRFWSRIVLVLVLLFPVLVIAAGALEGNVDAAMGGLTWQSLAYAVWEQFMCVAMVTSLLVWFRRRFNEQGRLAKTMSGAAYATYVFHAPTIVLLAFAVRGIKLDMGLKYVLMAPFAVGLAFLVGYVVKRLPLAREIL